MQIAGSVDIVILNCNNNGYIQRCINSIKRCTEGPYRLIVIDQNSKDGSRDWLKDSSGASHLIFNKKNIGTSEGRNQGIKAGHSEWIVFIDSDIEIDDKDWLDKLWNYTIDYKIGFIEAKVILNDWGSKLGEFSGISFCLVRRRCLNEIGYFDNKFLIGGEMDWFARLEQSDWVPAYCPDTKILHHSHTTMKASLADRHIDYVIKMIKLLQYKYTAEFLKNTLEVNSSRRIKKYNELIAEEGR